MTLFLLISPDHSSSISIHPAFCHGKLTWMGSIYRASLPSGFQLGWRSEGGKTKIRCLFFQLPPFRVILVWLCSSSEGHSPNMAAAFM